MALRNGMLPDSMLVSVPWDPVERLRIDALLALMNLNEAFKRRFGVNLVINEAYRDLKTQEKYYLNPPSGVGTAAKPGTSNHGWGLAVDIGGLGGKTGAKYLWMMSVAPDYGWFNPWWARNNEGIEEPWHWEFTGATDIVPDIIRTPEEIDMTPDQDQMLKDIQKELGEIKTKLQRQDLKFLYFNTPDGRPAVAMVHDLKWAIAPSEGVRNKHKQIMTWLGLVVERYSFKDWDMVRQELGLAENDDMVYDPEAFGEQVPWATYPGGEL